MRFVGAAWLVAIAATSAADGARAIDEALHTEGATLCADHVFLRRAHLDVIGMLPAAGEARAFLADTDPHKRTLLVDRLLRRPERADYWAMKWSERLRVKSEFPINLWPNAVQAYHRWIRTAMAEDLPYDRLARALLTSSGSNFRDPPVNFYRALPSREPLAIAQAVALTFMGARAERWPPEQRAGLAAFFQQVGYKPTAEWKEEMVFFDARKEPAAVPPVFPDGTPARVAPGQDPREVFADWLLRADNPWFARAAANRVWSWLVGRGLVHEADDMRPDNPPSHPEALARLASELAGSGYDLRHLYRVVLGTRAYQQAAVPARPLEAEVLVDALCRITGTREEYMSRIPEPFTYAPAGQEAVALADGSITSPFLETFGRPARDTGRESERTARATAAQRVHLLNSSHVQNKIAQGPGLQLLLGSRGPLAPVIDELYLTILSRFPTADERAAVQAYVAAATLRREAMADVAWALINSAEFVHWH